MSDTVGYPYTDCIKQRECSRSTAPSQYPLEDYINTDSVCSEYVKDDVKETKNG